MFESAEIGHEIDDATYEEEEPRLRQKLVEAQLRLVQEAKFPVVIVIAGVDGAGKGEMVNLLNEWMDPRHIQTHAMDHPTDEERERPPMWSFWRRLPPRGKIGIFFGSWYTRPIIDRVYGGIDPAAFEAKLEEIVRFERMLANEGGLVLKFWFHLSKKKQKKRLTELASEKRTRWRVTAADWKNREHYDEFRIVCETALRESSTAEAPWFIVEGWDSNYRSLTVGRLLLDALTKRLEGGPGPASFQAPVARVDEKNLLSTLNLDQKLGKVAAKKQMVKHQTKLNDLVRDPRFKERSVVVVFEGNDAAGKGGAIRRITSALDARSYDVIPVAAPTEEERAQPYLWRFWRRLPRRGKLTVFDRSWYGRVLVERVEGFCSAADWSRAYSEINDFEESLVENGIVVVKFWLAISSEEQLARFKAREEIAFKRFKITDEDWRNREKWDRYAEAVCEMVDRTSTDIAPWHLVEANDKGFARVKILRELGRAIEAAL